MRSIFTPPFRRAFLGNFFSDLAFLMFVHFPGFLKELGAGEATIGAIVAVAAGAAILARPWAGQRMDRYGRIPVLRAAAIVRLVATLAFFTVGTIGPAVYIIRAVYTVALAVFFTGLLTYASDVIPADRRSQAIAYYGLSGMAAATFGAALGGVLINHFGYPGLFGGMAVADVAALGIAWSLKPVANRPRLAPPKGALAIARHPALLPVWALTFGFGLGFGALLAFMRTFVDASGVGSVGLFFSVYSATAIFVRLSLSSVPDRVGPMRALYPAIGAFALGIGLLSLARTPLMLATAAMVAGSGHAFMFPILARLAVERSPEERRGVALSAYTAMFDLGPLFGAPILGLVIERFGYPPMFLTVAAVIVLSAGVFRTSNNRLELVP